MASIVLFLWIIFCLLKWEQRGTHFGYIYTSSWPTEMRMEGHAHFAYVHHLCLPNEMKWEQRGTHFRYVHHLWLLKWMWGWHGTLNMTHPWAKCLVPLVPHGRWERQRKLHNQWDPVFFFRSLSLSCKIRNHHTHKHNVARRRSPTSHKFHNSQIHWPPCGFHTCKIHQPTNWQHSKT